MVGNSQGGWKNRVEDGTDIVVEKLRSIGSKSAVGKELLVELDGIMKQRLKSRDSKIKSFSKKKIAMLAEQSLNDSKIERLKSNTSLS